MARFAACAAALSLALSTFTASAAPPLSELLRLERSEIGGVQVILNEVHEYPIVVLCLGGEGANVTVSSALERFATDRRGRWASTRAAGGSIDCVELPRTEIAAGFWALAQRWQEIERTARDGASQTDSAGDAQSIIVLARQRAGILATEVEEATPKGARLVLTVSGDFSSDEARVLAAKYLGSLRASDPVRVSHYRQTTERLSILEDFRLAAPVVHEAWLAPGDADVAMETAIAVLSAGSASRIGSNVIQHRRLATEATPFRFEQSGNWILGFSIAIDPRTTIDKALRFVDGAFKQIRFVGPTEKEVLRAKRLLATHLLRRLSSTRERAMHFTEMELVRGNAALVAAELTAYESVTRDAVREAVKRLVNDDRRCMVEAYPPGYAQDDPSLEGYELYTVQTDDTWVSLSARFGLRAEIIARDNDLDVRQRLTVGQVLWMRPKKPATTPKPPRTR